MDEQRFDVNGVSWTQPTLGSRHFWKKSNRWLHPIPDPPGRRVFTIIDGDGPDGSATHIGDLESVEQLALDNFWTSNVNTDATFLDCEELRAAMDRMFERGSRA